MKPNVNLHETLKINTYQINWEFQETLKINTYQINWEFQETLELTSYQIKWEFPGNPGKQYGVLKSQWKRSHFAFISFNEEYIPHACTLYRGRYKNCFNGFSRELDHCDPYEEFDDHPGRRFLDHLLDSSHPSKVHWTYII